MQALNVASELLLRSFLLATLLNLALTKRLFDIEFKTFQNWIGIVFAVGLALFYTQTIYSIFFNEPVGGNRLDYFKMMSLAQRLMYIFPIVTMVLNFIPKLRINKWVAIISLFVFVPRIAEFLIVLNVSEVTLMTINRVYSIPMLQMLVAGPVLYGLLVVWIVGLRIRD